ncbi:MAG: GxxExxY protein [Aequorivita sp.]
MKENSLSHTIIGAAIKIHSTLGPGLLKSVYETALAYDLREMGLNVRTQVGVPLIYKEVKKDIGYRIGILVEELVVIEVKSIENLAPVHFAQTLTYLRLSGRKLALLVNFNSVQLKDGIHRIVNNL